MGRGVDLGNRVVGDGSKDMEGSRVGVERVPSSRARVCVGS